MAWSPDGRVLATGDKAHRIRLWDQSGESLGVLTDHTGTVLALAFSPDGRFLLSGGADKAVLLWEVQQLAPLRLGSPRPLRAHKARVTGVAWSPAGTRFVTASDDGSLLLWERDALTTPERLLQRYAPITSVAYSSDGRHVACGLRDASARIVNVDGGKPRLLHHRGNVFSVAFSPDGQFLATGSQDATVRIWEVATGTCWRRIEKHTSDIRALAYSAVGDLLATKSLGSVRVWSTATWWCMDRRNEDATTRISTIAFHPSGLLTSCDDDQHSVCISQVERADAEPDRKDIRYRNAKVVLVGESGVGKSALALRLRALPFEATESTHARAVHSLASDTVANALALENREVFVWDLAGQPGYRIVNQLHLHDASVAVIVFDARHETEPFGGVRYWYRALHQARQCAGTDGIELPILLVAARADRGGVGTDARLPALLQELGIGAYRFFETSAKDGTGVDALLAAVLSAIPWRALPCAVSSEFLFRVRDFVVASAERGTAVTTVSALRDIFLAQHADLEDDGRGMFDAAIARLEPFGVVRRLSFGDYVLTKPELLDSFAASIVEAARREPDGLGIVLERDVREGRFAHELGGRSEGVRQSLAIGTIETLIRAELALREDTNEGAVLVFPAQSVRAAPVEDSELATTLSLEWQGPLDSIWATLIVRVCRSGVFERGELWRDGVLVRDASGALSGLALDRIAEAHGRVRVRAHRSTAPVIRAQLEQFVTAHLEARVIGGTLRVERHLSCPACRKEMPADIVAARLAAGAPRMTCPYCEGAKIALSASAAAARGSDEVVEMARHADVERERDAAATTLAGKRLNDQYDVFLSYHSADRAEVAAIKSELERRGVRPWFDAAHLPPGVPIYEEIGRQLDRIPVCAVFIGSQLGTFQTTETWVALERLRRGQASVIPVFLESAPRDAVAPAFLRALSAVDFRYDEPDPIERLRWGVQQAQQSRVD